MPLRRAGDLHLHLPTKVQMAIEGDNTQRASTGTDENL
jgi:hypothetical protein